MNNVPPVFVNFILSNSTVASVRGSNLPRKNYYGADVCVNIESFFKNYTLRTEKELFDRFMDEVAFAVKHSSQRQTLADEEWTWCGYGKEQEDSAADQLNLTWEVKLVGDIFFIEAYNQNKKHFSWCGLNKNAIIDGIMNAKGKVFTFVCKPVK